MSLNRPKQSKSSIIPFKNKPQNTMAKKAVAKKAVAKKAVAKKAVAKKAAGVLPNNVLTGTPEQIAVLKHQTSHIGTNGNIVVTKNDVRDRAHAMIIWEVGFDPLQPPNTPTTQFPPHMFGPQVRQAMRGLINGRYFNDVESQVSVSALSAANTFSMFTTAIWISILTWHKSPPN